MLIYEHARTTPGPLRKALVGVWGLRRSYAPCLCTQQLSSDKLITLPETTTKPRMASIHYDIQELCRHCSARAAIQPPVKKIQPTPEKQALADEYNDPAHWGQWNSHKRYRQRNPGKIRNRVYARKAKTQHATPRWLTAEQHEQTNKWYILGRAIGYHVDHIEPLNGENVCGLHVPWNLRLRSPAENCGRGNKPDRCERRAHMLRLTKKV